MTAGIMTTYYGPGASGSGVAELIGYMNGINYPDFIGINTLITKAVGVTFAVTGKLCVGKEGPLAHIGAIVGLTVLYIPGLGFEFLRNEDKKRQFVAAGASAGVSAAFGAPIGGALFCYEMSKPNTFWKFTMIWKVFFSCSVGNLTLAILTSLASGENEGWNTAALKFGNASTVDENDDVEILLPGAIIIGVIGGLIGPLFINLNTRVNVYRKKYLKNGVIKVVETTLFGFATAGIFFILPYLFETCKIEEGDMH
jgi:chloride channel 7